MQSIHGDKKLLKKTTQPIYFNLYSSLYLNQYLFKKKSNRREEAIKSHFSTLYSTPAPLQDEKCREISSSVHYKIQLQTIG
jgi:hypothetical protein